MAADWPTHCLCRCGQLLAHSNNGRPKKWASVACEARARRERKRKQQGKPSMLLVEKCDPCELGPDRPLLFMDEKQARERRQRIAEEMLRAGHLASEVEERFRYSPTFIRGLAKRLGVDTRTTACLPVGLPT